MEITVTNDRTRRSLVIELKDGPVLSGEDVDQNRHRVNAVSMRSASVAVNATIETADGAAGSIRVTSVKILGPQLKKDRSESDTLRCSATWEDNSWLNRPIDGMPAWLWAVVRNALTGSTQWTVTLDEDVPIA